MKLPVRIHQAAEVEIKEAADFYDNESFGLGDEFTADIEDAIERISRYPRVAPVARGFLRSKALMRFPYALVYFVGESEIALLAVAREKRRPFYWTPRL